MFFPLMKKKRREKKKVWSSAPFCLYLPIVAFYYRFRHEKGVIRPFVDPICRVPDSAWRIIYLLLDRTSPLPRDHRMPPSRPSDNNNNDEEQLGRDKSNEQKKKKKK